LLGKWVGLSIESPFGVKFWVYFRLTALGSYHKQLFIFYTILVSNCRFIKKTTNRLLLWNHCAGLSGWSICVFYAHILRAYKWNTAWGIIACPLGLYNTLVKIRADYMHIKVKPATLLCAHRVYLLIDRFKLENCATNVFSDLDSGYLIIPVTPTFTRVLYASGSAPAFYMLRIIRSIKYAA
jgi:hypothetical protein